MMRQLVFIHGGETFATYEEYVEYLRAEEYDPYEERSPLWKDTLAETLGEKWEVLAPLMPSKYNAKYLEWKIWFEKLVPHMKGDVTLVGWSLGGIFLAKYLAEEEMSVELRAVHLVAAPFDDADSEYSLADFVLPDSLGLLKQATQSLHFYHSKDDFVVPYADLEKYRAQLPDARFHIFEDRNHFLQESFPELIDQLQAD